MLGRKLLMKEAISTRKKEVHFKSFSGANTKQLDHYVIPVLVDEKQAVVIHIGSNDITKFNYHDGDVMLSLIEP